MKRLSVLTLLLIGAAFTTSTASTTGPFPKQVDFAS